MKSHYKIARGSVNPDIAKRLGAEFRIFDEEAYHDAESYKWISCHVTS